MSLWAYWAVYLKAWWHNPDVHQVLGVTWTPQTMAPGHSKKALMTSAPTPQQAPQHPFERLHRHFRNHPVLQGERFDLCTRTLGSLLFLVFYVAQLSGPPSKRARVFTGDRCGRSFQGGSWGGKAWRRGSFDSQWPRLVWEWYGFLLPHWKHLVKSRAPSKITITTLWNLTLIIKPVTQL